ncbi:MAG: protein kinase [Deltaproteobacteria bacterium]|nr:protein kinase [Deltaproteobacteria bacterium]
MAAARPKNPTAETGRRIGRYRLRRKIGSGGMGAVYLADIEGPGGFGKWFALKLIHPHFEDSDRLLRMFHEEANIAGRIEHPNVCQVTDFGRDDDGTLYLVLEYLRGLPLSAIMQSIGRDLPVWLGPRVVADAARGLHAAHELTTEDGRALGLVHRDVSPQNLFVLFAGPCKVLDFGIARIEGGMVTTREGELRGKLGYMAPEQIDDATSVDRRADVWALGVVLWEAITGKRLFHGGRHTDVVVRVLHERLTRPSKHRPECDKALDDIVLGALRRDREDRIASAGELADLLEDWLHGRTERNGHAAVSAYLKSSLPEAVATDERTILELGNPGGATPAPVLETDAATHDRPPSARLRVVPPPPPPVGRNVAPHRDRTTTIVVAVAAAVVAISLSIAVVAWSIRSQDSEQPNASTRPRPMDARPLSPQRGERQGEGPRNSPSEPPTPHNRSTLVGRRNSGPGPLTPNGERVGVSGEGVSGERSTSSGPGPLSPNGERVGVRGGDSPRSPSRTPRTPPATPVRSATGSLNLMAIPESDVYLRGRRLGRTPLVGTVLPEGTHRLELRPLNGSPRRFVTARIHPNRTTRLALRGTGSTSSSTEDP